MARPTLRINLLCCSILANLAVFGAAPAWAGADGTKFQSGNVTVTQSGTNTTVTQSTTRAVADWSSFDVLSNASVTFNQPGRSSAILNRIHSTTPSEIDGSLFAPGLVILQNANGVMFSGSAKVDVGSLVATSLQVNAQKFLDSGNLALNGLLDPDAVVSNAGTITATDRGLVALIGGHVNNSGLIQARLGTVALGSGSAATIDFGNDGLVQFAITDPLTKAPTNAGALVANSGRISADGGSVLLSAHAAAGLISRAINLDGVIEARGVAQQTGQVWLTGGDAGSVTLGPQAVIDTGGPSGGTVVVTGHSIDLAGGAQLSARGSMGNGGAIRLGGDYRGGGSLPHADTTTVAANAVLDASGQGGAGGSIVVWSDTQTTFDGIARANGVGGQGGLVETSSKGVLNIGSTAKVSTASTLRKTGSWLLDPDVINIVGSGGTASTPGDANNATGTSSIDASAIVAALASNNVQLIAQSLISVNAPIVATTLGGGAAAGLEMIAQGEGGQISINAPILLQNGNLALRATGNILLGTGNPGATDFNQRAIIAVGNGTVWMETPESGSIQQASNSAILANNLALISGSVSATSPDNFTLNLAGEALDGHFVFDGTTTRSAAALVGTVQDPFLPQSLSGVGETMLTKIGEQNIIATALPNYSNQTIPDTPITLSVGGATFDTLILSALPYINPPSGQTTDSSDFAVRQLSYSLNGTLHTITPETEGSAPAGFQLIPANGTLVKTYVKDGSGHNIFSNQAWGIDHFGPNVGGTDTDEIGFDPINQVSEELLVRLGGAVNQVNAIYRAFLADDFNGATEQAHVDFYGSVAGTPTINVTPATLTAHAASLSRTYGDPNPALSFAVGPTAYLPVDQYVASQLPGAYALPQPILTTAAGTTSPVGGYPINITLPPPTEFVTQRYATDFAPGTLTINPAQLLVAADDKYRLYGASNPELTWTTTGWKNGDQDHVAVQASLSTPATPVSNVGTYAINVDSAVLSDPSNRNYIIVTLPGTLTVSRTPLLLVLADDKERVYGTSNPTFTFQVSGWQGNDAANNSVTAALNSPATILSNVGNYPILVSHALLSGPASGNYTLVTQNGVLYIVPAPLTVAAGHSSKIYGALDPALTYTVTGLRGNDTAASVLNGVLVRDPGENVGTYAVLQGSIGLTTSNYILTFVNGSLQILPAPLDVIAHPGSKVFGDDDPPLSFRVDGLQNGDSLDRVISGGVARAPGEEIGLYPIGLGSISLLDPNYVLNFIGALFTILPPLHNPPDGLPNAYGLFFNSWRVKQFERGRDPDTPGDAVYRTTQYENPYIPDPLMRAYGIGGVWTGAGSEPTPAMLVDDRWLTPDNDRTGQHADRSVSPDGRCHSAPLPALAICMASIFMSDFWMEHAR